MAEFEPGDRPPRPPRRPNPKGDDGGFVQSGEDGGTSRRRLPRLRAPKALRRAYEGLPEDVRYRISVVWGFAQTGLLILFATLAVALLLKAITNATVFEPDNAKEVFAGVDDPEDVAYSVDTVRIKKIDGSLLRLDTIRGVQVDPKRRKMLALISGVGVTSFRTAYDGKTWVIKYRNMSQAKRIPDQMTVDELTPVYASELEPLGGKILNDKATVDGKRGWLVDFRPTRVVILRLLQAPMIVKLGLMDNDLTAIYEGKFKAVRSRATVLRGDRRLYQVDVTIKVNGALMRILATYRKQNEGQMKNLDMSPRKQTDVN